MVQAGQGACWEMSLGWESKGQSMNGLRSLVRTWLHLQTTRLQRSCWDRNVHNQICASESTLWQQRDMIDRRGDRLESGRQTGSGRNGDSVGGDMFRASLSRLREHGAERDT